MRRPLAGICLGFILCIFIYVYSRPVPRADEDYNYRTANVSGYVQDIKYKDSGQIIYLKDTEFSEGLFSEISSKYRGVICYMENEQEVHMGSFLVLSGTVSLFSEATNPGEFSLDEYYYSMGYITGMRNARIEYVSEKYSVIRDTLYNIRLVMEKKCDLIFGEKAASTIKAMILGNKDSLDPEIKTLYSENGIAHILAISGLHVSVIGMFFYNLLRKLSNSNTFAGISSGMLMLMYLFMTGCSSSAVRAVTMFIILLASKILGRTYDFFTTICLAAFIFLSDNMYLARYSGFILSYTAVFGAAVFAKYICVDEGIDNVKKKKFVNTLLSAIAISFFSLPTVLMFYYEFSIYSVILNLLVIPLMSIILTLAIIAVILSFVSFPVAVAAGYLCRIMLAVITSLCRFFDMLPGRAMVWGRPSTVSVAIFYTACFVIIGIVKYIRKERLLVPREKRLFKEMKPLKAITIKMSVMTLMLLLLIPIKSKDCFTMLDVGQGDSFVLRCGKETIMIDGGSSTKNKVAEYIIVPYLKYNGINHVDMWLISHPDNDHISALTELLSDEKMMGITIDSIILPDVGGIEEDAAVLIDLAEKRGIPIIYISRGHKIVLSEDISLICINPIHDYSYEDANEYSIVMLLNYYGKSGLLTGDSTKKSEEKYVDYLVENGFLPDQLEFLKVAHHGSSSSTSEEMLMYLRPKISLISCGQNNIYGHPHEEVLQILEEYGSRIYNTSEEGAVEIDLEK